MSESGDKEYPVPDYGYLNTRAILLVNINLLRQELNWISKELDDWSDEILEIHLHKIAERRREILEIAHDLMPSEEYKQYEDFVNVMIPTSYEKKYDQKKNGPKKRQF